MSCSGVSGEDTGREAAESGFRMFVLDSAELPFRPNSSSALGCRFRPKTVVAAVVAAAVAVAVAAAVAAASSRSSHPSHLWFLAAKLETASHHSRSEKETATPSHCCPDSDSDSDPGSSSTRQKQNSKRSKTRNARDPRRRKRSRKQRADQRNSVLQVLHAPQFRCPLR
jgi:hypothetical protein